MPVSGLPSYIEFDGTSKTVMVEELSCDAPGLISFTLSPDSGDDFTAGPLVITDAPHAGFWGDLHGQSGETIGIGRIEDYMNFARNRAFLDAVCHQGNDFQIKRKFWDHLNAVTAEWDESGRFTTFPGYEWSGNTAVGGDRNVIYASEGCTLRRYSHALLEQRDELENDVNTTSDLYKALRKSGEDTVIFAHVGGRYANIEIDHDADLETAVEIHSDWGTFEWMATDSFRLGRRIGIVANSDGHKGRPGASYPGSSDFGAYGGLTCFLAAGNTRSALFEAMRARHHYATTGCRLYLDVAADTADGTKMMGDIAAAGATEVTVRVTAYAGSGIETIEIRNGAEVIETMRSHDAASLGRRVRVAWSGAEYRGLGRNTRWRGVIDVDGAEILSSTPINRWNPEGLLEQRGRAQMGFESVTTGNFGGVDLYLDSDDAELTILTNLGDLAVKISDLGVEPFALDCGGLERKLTVTRLPDAGLEPSMSFEGEVVMIPGQDNPVWVCVTMEDGHQAWSSPIYLTT